MMKASIAAGLWLCLPVAPALADPGPDDDITDEAFVENADAVAQRLDHVRYAFPDLPGDYRPTLFAESNLVTVTPGMRLIGDYTSFHQDAAGLRQLGPQDSGFQLRSARLQLFGLIGRGFGLRYNISAEYRGFATNPERTWQLSDFAVSLPIRGLRNTLNMGRIKQAFGYEPVNSGSTMAQDERILGAFAVARSNGVRMTHVLGATRRATLSYGFYSEGRLLGSLAAGATSSSGHDASVRLTGLVWESPANDDYLHVGISYRHVGSDGTLRYQSRPEANIADPFADTGRFAAQGADHVGVELLWSHGPFSILAESITAYVNAPDVGNPRFHGSYLLGSWIVTGEARGYDRNNGFARRVVPAGRWGAPELVASLARIDLDDRGIRGGRYDKAYIGVNWWATTRWNLGTGWGRTWLTRAGERSVTDIVLTRVQWVY